MRILLIDTAFLGDLFLATPLIRGAAEIAAGGCIDLLTSPAGQSAVAHHPLIGETFVLDKRAVDGGTRGFTRAWRWIRTRQPDVALLPRRSLRSALLARMGRVPRRIGFGDRAVRLLMTDTVPFDPSLHQVERNLELLRPLGVDPARSGRAGHPLEAFAADEEKHRVKDWLAGRRIDDGFVAVAPGSVWETKRWPVERYAELSERLAGEYSIVIVGGRREQELAAALREGVDAGRRERVHDACGLWSPEGTVALLRHAAVLVSNDSGALHLGQAAALPVVALYGPTGPVLGYAPRGAAHRIVGVEGLPCRPCGRHGGRRCPRGHWRCMLDLSVGSVMERVRDATERAA
ncbi:MAG: glycosyltransferase family 9 protein [Acidobacteriota bacterium]